MSTGSIGNFPELPPLPEIPGEKKAVKTPEEKKVDQVGQEHIAAPASSSAAPQHAIVLLDDIMAKIDTLMQQRETTKEEPVPNAEKKEYKPGEGGLDDLLGHLEETMPELKEASKAPVIETGVESKAVGVEEEPEGLQLLDEAYELLFPEKKEAEAKPAIYSMSNETAVIENYVDLSSEKDAEANPTIEKMSIEMPVFQTYVNPSPELEIKKTEAQEVKGSETKVKTKGFKGLKGLLKTLRAVKRYLGNIFGGNKAASTQPQVDVGRPVMLQKSNLDAAAIKKQMMEQLNSWQARPMHPQDKELLYGVMLDSLLTDLSVSINKGPYEEGVFRVAGDVGDKSDLEKCLKEVDEANNKTFKTLTNKDIISRAFLVKTALTDIKERYTEMKNGKLQWREGISAAASEKMEKLLLRFYKEILAPMLTDEVKEKTKMPPFNIAVATKQTIPQLMELIGVTGINWEEGKPVEHLQP